MRQITKSHRMEARQQQNKKGGNSTDERLGWQKKCVDTIYEWEKFDENIDNAESDRSHAILFDRHAFVENTLNFI